MVIYQFIMHVQVDQLKLSLIFYQLIHLKQNKTMVLRFFFKFIRYDLLYLAIFSNKYDIVKILLQKGYQLTREFFINDPWAIIGRNHSPKIVKLLLTITDFSTKNSISGLINANFFDAISLLKDNLSVELNDIEKFCLKFESICDSIKEERALMIFENLLETSKNNFTNNLSNKQIILFYVFL